MKTVKVNQFGKDHWSLFSYLETCAVDHQGQIDPRRLRCNQKNHPGLNHNGFGWKQTYGTIIKGGKKLGNHDDWDCFYDLEAAGFIRKDVGTGMFPIACLTEQGLYFAGLLRKHKANGGMFATFEAVS